MKSEIEISCNSHRKFRNSLALLLPADRTTLLFAVEGLLIALINSIINNNNNLFATRMGASDFQVSLVASLPQFIGMLVLIPGGIWADRMTNKRKIVNAALICLAATYALIGFTPMLGNYRLIAFIGLLALAAGPMTLYNASWQAYFSDVVPSRDMNSIFSLRTRGTFLMSVAAPLITGALLSSTPSNSSKIVYHQWFFWVSCVFAILQILSLNKIQGGNVEPQSSMSLREIIGASKEIVKNKRYISFVGVAVFFYMTWQSDWALYYIGQVNYLKLNEAWLSYVCVGGALVQFLTIGFWSRMNEKFGVRFSIIIGSLGLACFPICMIVSTSVPLDIAPVVFLTINTLSNFAFATVTLNILQCLLQVTPEKNKTLSISIYTVLTTLSNAIMPMIGVQVYNAFGATREALHITFYIIFAARILATSLWLARWWLMRNEPK